MIFISTYQHGPRLERMVVEKTATPHGQLTERIA
jgi:hypothetical protein